MAAQRDLIERADAADIDDILQLQNQNSPANGGALSVAFSRQWFAAAIPAMPVMVARCECRLIGYTLSSTFAAQAHVPIIQAMLQCHPIPHGAYLYGPVCVAQAERGRGLAGLLFAALRRELPGRRLLTFIRRDNIPSRRAHARMGLREAAEFTHAGETYLLMACGSNELPAQSSVCTTSQQRANDTRQIGEP
jgi:L-amino acid N-acyltransferase YncA